MGCPNNIAVLQGIISEPIVPDHMLHGETFYKTAISVMKRTGGRDVIPVIVSERILEAEIYDGFVKATGTFRSYNYQLDGSSHVRLYLFADTLESVDAEKAGYINEIELNGFICKKPLYHKTTYGRKTCSIIFAVNRWFGHSDYIPCIATGRNASYLRKKQIGTQIRIRGRIRSHEYPKKISETESVIRVAYDVIIYEMEVVDGEKCKDQVADAE